MRQLPAFLPSATAPIVQRAPRRWLTVRWLGVLALLCGGALGCDDDVAILPEEALDTTTVDVETDASLDAVDGAVADAEPSDTAVADTTAADSSADPGVAEDSDATGDDSSDTAIDAGAETDSATEADTADATGDASPDDAAADDAATDAGAADSSDDAAVVEDVAPSDSVDDATAEDTSGQDAATDATAADAGPADAGPADAGPSCPGASGCPCSDSSACASGACVADASGAQVCAQTCTDGACPAGFACVPGAAQKPPVCLPKFAQLCNPCKASADCASGGASGAACVDQGKLGRFCGTACAADSDCPDSYQCSEVSSTEGATVKQCVRKADADQAPYGICPCSAAAIAQQLSTVCGVEAAAGSNLAGMCMGTRSCGPTGLSACSAKPPEAESCNGNDDDCDGVTDEGTCDDQSPCTQDICDGKGCSHPAADGGACSDNDPCTVGDACQGGACKGGPPPACDDGNPCTQDACGAGGKCVSTPAEAPCDADGDACTVSDACKDGKCIAGKALVCEDNNACTSDACVPTTGKCDFVGAPLDGKACDADGSACTPDDACKDGACKAGAALDCNDSNPCTKDVCNAAGKCENTPAEGPCDDGAACTENDSCAAGTCQAGTPKLCDDGNTCTEDSCDAATGNCQSATAPVDGKVCDADASVCTPGDSCKSGACVAGSQLTCDDANPCTDDACDAKTGCVYQPNGQPCADGDLCTSQDTCSKGACTGTPIDLAACDDNNPCTTDSCDPAKGCVNPAVQDGKGCDDGEACTNGDQCQGGVCTAGKNVCGCKVTADCAGSEDGNLCNGTLFCDTSALPFNCKVDPKTVITCPDGKACEQAACDAKSGKCGLQPIANGTPCDADGSACTVEDSCQDGLCKAGATQACNDQNPCTVDSCKPSDGSCVYTPAPAPCDDGNACTGNDSCSDGSCGGAAVVCDDGNPCTEDSCDKAAGCQYAAAPMEGKSCDDGDVCSGSDTCAGGTCGGKPLLCVAGKACVPGGCDPIPSDCADILAKKPGSPSGVYLIDPSGGSETDAFQAYCDMDRDGGGWTLAVKHWFQDGTTGNAAAIGTVGDATTLKGKPYKLADASIAAIAGGTYDVLVDQAGFATGSSTGNFEFAVLRNYTGAWKWTGAVAESTTTTHLMVYRSKDSWPLWQGRLKCGQPGFGINCIGVAAGITPGGGLGCGEALGTQVNAAWANLVMAAANSDSQINLCNGAQQSSSPNLNHRFWFRKTKPYPGVPDATAKLVTTGLAKSCLEALQLNPAAKDGVYWIDPSGGDTRDAYPALCDMTRQGGGWTLGVKHWYQSGVTGVGGALNGASQAATLKGNGYKISDADINIIGGAKYDVLIDQAGFNSAHSKGNYEYLTLRNYTAKWTFTANVALSSTPISIQSYRGADDALAWTGSYQCGNVGGFGINCVNNTAGVRPGGGMGCAIAMGSNTDPNWRDFYMADANTDSRYYMCNGAQHSSGQNMNHRYWFRAAQPWQGVPGPDGKLVTSGLPKSCDDVQTVLPKAASGAYWIDPNGNSVVDAYQVYCDMVRDGGGWTLAVKHWYQSGVTGIPGAYAGASQALLNKGRPFKLSDPDINTIAGASYDVMIDQIGHNTWYSTGNFEYALIRNYTAPFTFAGPVPASSTPTLIQSYRASDNALAWQGNLLCGHVGGFGINCRDTVAGTVPGGGQSCDISMGSASNGGWNHLYMSETNTDTYVYLCNGAQHSSSMNMNHRYWFRKARPWQGVQDYDGQFKTSGLPKSCLEIKQNKSDAADGVYWVDPSGGSATDAMRVQCNMTRQGGGWTLGLKHWYQSGIQGIVGSYGSVNDAMTIKGKNYKLSDAQIQAIAGKNYDVMFDQAGHNNLYSSGNFEYVTLRNYTAPWTWGGKVDPSTTPTSVQSYRISDDALAWTGTMTCGAIGGWGINCIGATSGPHPGGGMGCGIAMGTATDPNWRHLFMAEGNSDTYTYICNGAQHSSNQNMSQRYWFRAAQPWQGVPDASGQLVTSGLPKACDEILAADAGAKSGTYWVDFTGGGVEDAQLVHCDMDRQGGGWTLAIKHWYASGLSGIATAYAGASQAKLLKGRPYKLSDAQINLVGGPTYDVLIDQEGFNSLYSSGNFEYAVIRNYTAPFKFNGLVAASSTKTTMQSYRAFDDELAWSGNLECGNVGGVGINCLKVLSGSNPQGGNGCLNNMGNASNAGWHHIYMSETNSDSYLYLCNGAQHSSNQNMNHRYWFRKTKP